MAANIAALRNILLCNVRCRATNTSLWLSMPNTCIRQPQLLPSRHNQHHIRTFTTTLPSHKNSIGPLPTFAPTSNPELDTLLEHVREELFIPPHLLKRHRLLMYRHKYHYILEEEPLYYDIGNQSVQLKPKMNAQGIPRKIFTKAVQLMQVPSDFDAIPGLVLGFAQANRMLKDKHFKLGVRQAGLKGRADVLLQILSQTAYNGVRISRSIAREGMRGLSVQVHSGTAFAARRAVRRAKRLVTLLSKQDSIVRGEYTSQSSNLLNKGSTETGVLAKLGPPPEPIASDPLVLGYLAGIAAETAILYEDGLDFNATAATAIQSLFDKKSWSRVVTMLSETREYTPPPELKKIQETEPSKTEFGLVRERREELHDLRAWIMQMQFFIMSLKSAFTVLSTTLTRIQPNPGILFSSSPTSLTAETETKLLPAKSTRHISPKENISSLFITHAKTLEDLTKQLMLEIPRLEQVVEKWTREGADLALETMGWDEKNWRWRIQGSVTKYKNMGETINASGAMAGDDVVDEVYDDEEEERM